MKSSIFMVLAFGILSIASAAWGQCPPGQVFMGQQSGNGWNAPICVPAGSNSPPTPEVWNNYWGAIVRDPKTGQLGTSNHQDSKSQAIKSANADCVQRGGFNCETRLTYRNVCAAVATGTNSSGLVAKDTLEEAKSRAIALCNEDSTTPCTILYTDCSLPVRVR